MTTRFRHSSAPRTGWLRARLRGALALCLCALVLLGQALPAFAPSAGAFLGDFTVKDEVELGKKFNVLIKARLPLVEDPEVKEYVRSIVERLKAVVPPQPFDFETNVLLHNAVNAFASPGGYIFVHTGLLMAMEHESEVAGVLAHEMAHVTQRHIANRIEKSQRVTLLSLAGALAGAFMGGGGSGKGAAVAGSMAAGQAAMLNYSRIDESEADQVGMQYLVAAGFRPDGMAGAFEKLRRQSWMTGTDVPTYLSTHPNLTDRISEVRLRVEQQPAGVRNRQDDDERFRRVQLLVRARYADATIALRTFEQAKPDDCMSQLGRAILYSRLNRVGEATAAFDKALACNPRDQLVWREAGRFHYTKGDRHRAAQMLQRAVLMNSRDYMALFFYARLLFDAGQRNEAYTYYREVLRHLPEDSEVHDYYGRALGMDGQVFKGYLHLAYSALYANEKEKVEQLRDKARAVIRTPEDQADLERFDARYQERKAFW
jgi:predicted Zn-dependent protease